MRSQGPTCSWPGGPTAAQFLDPPAPKPTAVTALPAWASLPSPKSDVGEGVSIKTPRGRSGPIQWCAGFPLRDVGEVTKEVSGIWGLWKEIPRHFGALLSGPRLPNHFHTTEALEVPPSPKHVPSSVPGAMLAVASLFASTTLSAGK